MAGVTGRGRQVVTQDDDGTKSYGEQTPRYAYCIKERELDSSPSTNVSTNVPKQTTDTQRLVKKNSSKSKHKKERFPNSIKH
jgi:hypothetical protein